MGHVQRLCDMKCLLRYCRTVLFPRPKKRENGTAQQVHCNMVGGRPRHRVQIFGREHGPDEQMRPQGSTCCHYGHQRCGDVECQQRSLVVALRASLGSKQMACGNPPDRACPVADERQNSHHHHAIAADTVVGA